MEKEKHLLYEQLVGGPVDKGVGEGEHGVGVPLSAGPTVQQTLKK